MVDGKVGVLQHAGADRQIDNEINDLGDGDVYRQRVVGFGPNGEALASEDRLLAMLVEILGMIDELTEATPLSGKLTVAGDTIVLTPAMGKRIRIRWLHAIDARTDPPPIITWRFGVNDPFYTTYGLSKKQRVTGGTDEAVIANLDNPGEVAWSLLYEEIA